MKKNELIKLCEETSLNLIAADDTINRDIVKVKESKPVFSFDEKIVIRHVAEMGGFVFLFSRYSVKSFKKCNDGRYRTYDISELPLTPISRIATDGRELFYIAKDGMLVRGKLNFKENGFGKMQFTIKKLPRKFSETRCILDLWVDTRRIVVLASKEIMILKREMNKLIFENEYCLPVPLRAGIIHQNEIIALGLYQIWYFRIDNFFAKEIEHQDLPISNLQGFDWEKEEKNIFRIIFPDEESISWALYDCENGKIIECGKTGEVKGSYLIQNVRFFEKEKCIAICSNYVCRLYEFKKSACTCVREYPAPGSVFYVTNDMHAVLSNGHIVPLCDDYSQNDIEITPAHFLKRSVFVDERFSIISENNRRLRFTMEDGIQTRELHHFHFDEYIPELVTSGERYCVLKIKDRIVLADHEGDFAGTLLPEKIDYVSAVVYDNYISLCYLDQVIVYTEKNGVWVAVTSLLLDELPGVAYLSAALYTGDEWYVAGSKRVMRFPSSRHGSASPIKRKKKKAKTGSHAELVLLTNVVKNDCEGKITAQTSREDTSGLFQHVLDFDVWGLAIRRNYCLAWGENRAVLFMRKHNGEASLPAVFQHILAFNVAENVTGMDIIESEEELLVYLATPSGLWRYDCSKDNQEQWQKKLARRYYEEGIKYYKVDFLADRIESNDFDKFIEIWESCASSGKGNKHLRYCDEPVARSRMTFLHSGEVVL